MMLVVLSPLAMAQERPFRESVSINVDPDAAKSLRMIRDQWENGPDPSTLGTLIDLCETRGDLLVLQDRGVSGGAARFVRLQSASDELIAGLPSETLTTYRQRIDRLAEPWWKAWQSTGDSRYLDRLVTRAFFSSWGDDALWAAAQERWNREDYPAAKRLWQRLLPAEDTPVAEPRYPDSAFPPAEVMARLILCDLFAGQTEAAQRAWKLFAERFPEANGSLGGRTGRWADLLKEVLEQSASWDPQVTSEDVVTYGGNESRQRVAPQSLDIGGELWSVPLPNPRLPAANRPLVFPPPLPLAFHPAVLDDLVLLNDGRQLHAWNLYSGKPYWDAAREGGDILYPLIADPLPMIPGRAVVGQAQWTVTVAQGRVYARMGSAVTTPAVSEFRDLPAEMVCLDISQGEGQLLWKQTADEFAPTEGDLPAWRWEGSPVVESGRVYAVLSRRRPQLEWSLVCLDAESGLLLWHRPVGVTRPTPPDQENRATSLLLTAGGGQLFLVTGWGAIVAVNPRDGLVNWAATYESTAPANDLVGSIPPVYVDGRLYAALADGDRLVCLNAASGRFVWSRPLTEPVRDMLGVAQDRVIVSGRSLWGFDARTGDLAWSVPSTDPDDWGFGRGTLAGDHVLWTTNQVLWFIDQRSGALLRDHPLRDADAPRSGGNITVSHGVILIAGADRLTAYGEFARLREPLQRPLSDARRNWRRELKLAEIAWAAGEPKQAEALWDHILKQPESAPLSENRRAQARVSLLPGRRSSRTPTNLDKAIPATPIAASSDVRSPPRLAPPTTGYWQRLWQKPVDRSVRARIPVVAHEDQCASVLVDGARLSMWDAATGIEAVLTTTPAKIEWCGQWPHRTVCVTDDEILVWDRDRQSVRQRLPRPAATMSESTRWIVHPEGLLVLASPRSVSLLNVTSGEWQWHRESERGGWQAEIGWDAHRLAVHPRGQGGAEIWDVRTGRTLRREHPASGPWKAAPLFFGENDDYVTLQENDRLMGSSTVPLRRWEFVGVVSSVLAPPWMFSRRGDCFVVIEGQRVVRIQPDSGWSRWSTAIADLPLRDPAVQTAVWNGTLFAASAGSLVAMNLETGSVLWKSALPSAVEGQLRCVVLDEESSAATLAVIPAAATDVNEVRAHVGSVDLFTAETGQRCQTLRLREPAREVDIAAAGRQRAVLVTEHEVAGLHRP